MAATLAQRSTELSFTLKPVRAGAAEVSSMAVRGEIRGPLGARDRALSFRIPMSHAFRPGIAERVDSLVVRDASGMVPIRVETDPVNKSGYTYYRHWRAERPVVTPLVYSYHIRPQPRPSPGPVYDFYAHDGGLSTGGVQIFVLPESIGTVTTRVKWDLSDLAPGSIAVGTWGEGDFELKRGAYELPLVESFYMAGRLGHYAPRDNPLGFHGYWLGTPTYDPMKEMAWSYRAYDYLKRFYRDTISSYRAFVRIGGAGGTSHYNSFMTGATRRTGDSTIAGPHRTFAHEMGHYFVGWLSGAPLGSDLWYGDGVNEHFTRVLLIRAGLAPMSDYLEWVNTYARGYYTSKYRNLSNDSLQSLGYSTGLGGSSAQSLAYSKGSLFFSELDYRIRLASQGRRKLEDMLLPVFERRRNGQPLTLSVLVDAIERELGQPGRAFFDAIIMRGETLVPASGAFGPCLERQPTKYTVDEKEIDGYTWTRKPDVPDDQCRQW